MRHNDQETAELTRDVIELSRELAELKRQHEQLRAAALTLCDWASEAREFMSCADDPSDDGYAVAHHLCEAEKEVRAALDATSAESVRTYPAPDTFDPDAVRELLSALPRSNNPARIEKLAQYVRDSERHIDALQDMHASALMNLDERGSVADVKETIPAWEQALEAAEQALQGRYSERK